MPQNVACLIASDIQQGTFKGSKPNVELTSLLLLLSQLTIRMIDLKHAKTTMPSYYHRYWCSICHLHPSHCCHSCPCHHCHRRCYCCRQVHYYCHSYRLHCAGLTTANAIAICCHVLSLIIPFIVIIFN